MIISQLIPVFIPTLLVILSTAAYANPPEICRIQRGNTKTIWGSGFEQEQTEVYVWDVSFEQDGAIAALKDTPYNRHELRWIYVCE